MSVNQTEIRVKGKNVYVPSTEIAGRNVINSGRWLKLATIQDEDLVEGEMVADPESFAAQLKKSGLNSDIFTFVQKLPDVTPKYKYHTEWDNLAVIPITTYSNWWDKQVEPSVRRAVRKATKSGVIVKRVEFTDEFVKGIVSIHNESPVRQGKAFWHYQKSFEAVKEEYSTYADRNVFLGAYVEDELIGFIRITYVDRIASMIQILGKMSHFDKRPTNALIAKAVEICEQDGASHLMYCNYVYNDPNSSLTEFKRRNGFEMALVPRYFIPLTLKGKIALWLGIHRGLVHRIPKPVMGRLLKLRSYWYERKLKEVKEAV
jgi:hypothetical protein